ncbi:uncharacterized protein N7459_006365 [Penicillium hispanicum]|uniref:uncharacterized protein n=1 Tax=Penicillium hispanicum TaxID=1080232 RepID=UPI002540FE1F|nr:uncharacterized protein N7459_006365 [Penicillium hispanicum]KAJ5577401.1 hypothetical protein N7459_006365 [Penicillium hispanicum]
MKTITREALSTSTRSVDSALRYQLGLARGLSSFPSSPQRQSSTASIRAVGDYHSPLAGGWNPPPARESITDVLVALRNADDSLLFARTIKEQASLAALVRELRHDDNSGFKVYEDASVDLYACLIDLPNVETLAMRMRSSCLPLQSPLHNPDQYIMLFPFEESIYAMFDLDCAKAGVGDARRALRRAREQDPNGDHTLGRCPGKDLDRSLFVQARLRATPGRSALRSYHIRSDYNCELGQTGDMRFDQLIFCHPTLKTLCITNCRMDALYRVKESQKPPTSSTALKELTLLNCNISPHQLSLAMKYPKALQKFTYRGVSPDTLLSLSESDDDALTTRRLWKPRNPHWSPWTWISTRNLKLPNLCSFTCQIPDNLEAMWTRARLSENGLRYDETFKELSVALSVVQVPYPTTIPDYKVCSCECLEYYHRFPIHRIEDVPDFPMVDDDDPCGDDTLYLYDIDFPSPDVQFSGDPDEMMDYYW